MANGKLPKRASKLVWRTRGPHHIPGLFEQMFHLVCELLDVSL